MRQNGPITIWNHSTKQTTSVHIKGIHRGLKATMDEVHITKDAEESAAQIATPGNVVSGLA